MVTNLSSANEESIEGADFVWSDSARESAFVIVEGETDDG